MPPYTDQSEIPAGPQGAARVDGGGRLFRFSRLSHIFASVIREALEAEILRRVAPAPLTASQLHVLKLMSVESQHQVREVARLLGVSSPAATKNIDKLERLGLIVRTPSKGDRRATLLSLSEEARRLVRDYEEARTARLDPLLENFGADELEHLCGSLERFSTAVLSSEAVASTCCLRCAGYFERHCPVANTGGGCPCGEVQAARSPRGADGRA